MAIFRPGKGSNRKEPGLHKKTKLLEKDAKTRALDSESNNAALMPDELTTKTRTTGEATGSGGAPTVAISDAGSLFRTTKLDSALAGGIDSAVEDEAPAPKSSRVTAFVDPDFTFSGEHQKGAVTGWLVVIQGPGKGESHCLRHGAQEISRANDADVHLTDTAITAQGPHAIIHYDPNTREFALNRGQATPNMYVQPPGEKLKRLDVGAVHILNNLDQIHFGDSRTTRVQFTPFCGDHFCWSELEDEE